MCRQRYRPVRKVISSLLSGRPGADPLSDGLLAVARPLLKSGANYDTEYKTVLTFVA